MHVVSLLASPLSLQHTAVWTIGRAEWLSQSDKPWCSKMRVGSLTSPHRKVACDQDALV